MFHFHQNLVSKLNSMKLTLTKRTRTDLSFLDVSLVEDQSNSTPSMTRSSISFWRAAMKSWAGPWSEEVSWLICSPSTATLMMRRRWTFLSLAELNASLVSARFTPLKWILKFTNEWRISSTKHHLDWVSAANDRQKPPGPCACSGTRLSQRRRRQRNTPRACWVLRNQRRALHVDQEHVSWLRPHSVRLGWVRLG